MIVGLEVVDDLIGKMMHIDYHSLVAGCLELHDDMPQQWLPSYPYQCLGHGVSQGFKPRSQSCGENHDLFCFHAAKLRIFCQNTAVLSKKLAITCHFRQFEVTLRQFTVEGTQALYFRIKLLFLRLMIIPTVLA